MSNFDKIDFSKVKPEIYTGEEEPKEKFQNKKKDSPKKDSIIIGKIHKESFFDNLRNEEDIEIGFEFKLIKRNELNVNLIHFDKNMTNAENYKYYNTFKVDVVGGFLAIDDLNFFKGYLEVIKEKKIPFVVMSSGSSAQDVIPICLQYPFIKEVIIFCGNTSYHEHYKYDYPNYIKKVSNDFDDICNYSKSFGPEEYRDGINNYIKSETFLFTYEDIQMNKQFEQCPVISALEYDNCYFLIHRAYAHFFGDMNSQRNVFFNKSQFNESSIKNSPIIHEQYKANLVKKFKNLVGVDNFVEQTIRYYTGERAFATFLIVL